MEEVSTKIKSQIKKLASPYLAPIEPSSVYFFATFFAIIYAIVFFLWFDHVNDDILVYSNYLMLVGATVASITSIVYIFTANPFFPLLAVSSTIGNFLCELIIGTVYYYEKMDIITGYIHHIVYILIFTIGIHIVETSAIYSIIGIAEIPTALLAAKRVWKIDSHIHEFISAITFFLFRIILWIPLWCVSWFIDGATAIEKILLPTIFGLGAASLHIQWFMRTLTKWVVPKTTTQCGQTTNEISKPIVINTQTK